MGREHGFHHITIESICFSAFNKLRTLMFGFAFVYVIFQYA